MRIMALILSLIGWCAMVGADGLPVSLEHLARHYVDYNGKRIAISGEVVSSDEMTVMYLPGANGDSTSTEGMLITLSPDARKKSSALVARLKKDLRKKGRVVAELEGKFESAADRRWGHLACFRFRLSVERVISLR